MLKENMIDVFREYILANGGEKLTMMSFGNVNSINESQGLKFSSETSVWIEGIHFTSANGGAKVGLAIYES